MAINGYDQITAITQKKFIPKMYDNIFDSNIIMQRMKKNSTYKKLDGGERVVVPLNYAQVTANAWYTGAETLDTTDNETIAAAEYTWKQHHTTVSISRADELKNTGDSQILDFVKSKIKIAEKTSIDVLGTGIYSNATNAKSIVGLRQIVGTSNTVGGISQTTYTWWAGQLDSSTTTLTIAAMQSRYNLCVVDNEKPSIIPTTRTLYNFYYALLQPQQRFMDAETAKGGFQSLMFNGVPVVADSHCPASHMFFLNEDNLALYVHKDEDFRSTPFQAPINQNVKVMHIYWQGAFGSSNNRLHGLLSAITA
jgi:hypothetical protein